MGVRRDVCSGRVCLGNYMQTGVAGEEMQGVLWVFSEQGFQFGTAL